MSVELGRVQRSLYPAFIRRLSLLLGRLLDFSFQRVRWGGIGLRLELRGRATDKRAGQSYSNTKELNPAADAIGTMFSEGQPVCDMSPLNVNADDCLFGDHGVQRSLQHLLVAIEDDGDFVVQRYQKTLQHAFFFQSIPKDMISARIDVRLDHGS